MDNDTQALNAFMKRERGVTAAAQAEGTCRQCKLEALPRCYSDAGRREYAISGMCETCFDDMFAEEEGPGLHPERF